MVKCLPTHVLSAHQPESPNVVPFILQFPQRLLLSWGTESEACGWADVELRSGSVAIVKLWAHPFEAVALGILRASSQKNKDPGHSAHYGG